MPATKTPRIIAVLGATGNQGSGVVRALLNSDKEWHVRALTRDVNSSHSRAVSDEFSSDASLGHFSLAFGNIYDVATLRTAFNGAYGVFAVTSEIYPGKVLYEEAEMAHEIEAGSNIVSAAKDTGIEHFVFSSLPDMVETTEGRFPGIHHMNNKHTIEQMAREHLSGVTFLIPGFFYTNMRWPQYSQRRSDGVVRFCTAIPSNQVAQWTDSSYDMGLFAAKVFGLGIDSTMGNTYLVMSAHVTPEQMAETFTKVTGQPAVHDPISPEKFAEMTAPFVGPAFESDAKQMMEWASVMPADRTCYGAMELQEDSDDPVGSYRQLGLKASTFEEWLRRSGWQGPQ